MAGEDLLDQRRARPRHPDDEYRAIVVQPRERAILEFLLRECFANLVEEAEGLLLLILELGALQLPADDIVMQRPLVLAAIVQRLGVSEVQRQERIGLRVLRRLEDPVHFLVQFVTLALGEVDEVVEVGVGAEHAPVAAQRLQQIVARFVQPPGRFQSDAVEVERLGVVRARLEGLFEHLERFVVAIGFMKDLAEHRQDLGILRLMPESEAHRLLAQRIGSPAQLRPRGDDQGGNMRRSDLQRVAQHPQRFGVLLLRDVDVREIVVRLGIGRVLVDRLSERMLGFVDLALLLKQGAEVVVGLRIALALNQRVLVGVDRAFDVADDPERVAEIVVGLGKLRRCLDAPGDRIRWPASAGAARNR